VPPPKPTTTTLPDYTPAVSAVLGQVGRKDWVGAAEAAAQLSARSGGRDAHEKLLAIVRCGVQAGDERAKARELFLGKVSPEFEAADKRLGEAQKRVAAVDPAKLSAAPFDALKAELDGARNDFTAVIKSEQTKATEAQKAALETTSALNAARNADWKAAGEAADRALAIPAANKPALQRLKEVAASGAKATTLRTEAAQKLPAELKNAEAFKAAEAKYRGALEKLGGLNAATLDAAQLDPVLAALDESPAAYRKLLDEGRKLEEQKAQLERDIRARLAEVLAAARDGDWDGAAKAATQLTTLSKNAPAHARLMTAAQAGLRAAGEREQTRKLFAGKTSPEFNAAEARLADTQKRLAALDAAKLDAAPLDALTAELDGARNAFAEVTRVEKQKATEAQKLALETTTALNAARNGDWKSAADAAERANAIAKGHPAQAKLKEVAAAGLKLAELRAEADQKLSPETKAAEPYAAVENKYRALLDRLGGLDASKLDAALLEPALTGLADAQGAYQKLIRDEAARGEVTVRVARELRTGLAAAREGDWKGYSEAVGRAAGLGGAATMMQKLRDIGEAGAQTATARAMAMRFAVGGKVPSSAIAPDTRFSDARERIGALNASKLDTAAVDKLLADLRECRDQFRKAASEFFTAAYPNLAKPIQGTNLVPGLTELHDAQQRCPELPEVIDLAAKYDPRGENLAIIGELLKAKQQARDYAGPDEAARVRKSLDDAVTRCDRLAADAFYRESVSVLRRRLVRARAIASDAAGNPAGMLADAWVLQQAGEESARLLVDRAVQSFMEKLAVGIERDPKSVVKMLESAGAELGPEACAPARKMLTDTLVASKLAQRVFGDRTLTRLWVQQIGPVSPPGMTRVPPGAFPLGQEYKGLVSLTPSYAPEHEVAVAVFYIDVTEVTNEMYQQFVDAGGYGTDAFWAAAKGVDRAAFVDETGKPGPIRWQNGRFPEGEGKMPVTGLSWYEASAYAAWAGKMLPTEVQWECAAVGTPPKEPGGTYTDSVYPWGNKWIKGHAQVDNTKALPVGSKSDDKSPVGCLDMAGNVREWTASPYEKYVNSVSQDKDLGAGLVVVRGASYKESSLNAQAAVRRARAKETRDDRIGFRCVWLPPAVER
jgi:iron(II)-dependent oxidoreductase